MKLFFVNVFLLYSLCAAQVSEVSQPGSLQTVKIGDPVTIECYIKSIVMKRVWYKVTTDRKLLLVVTHDSKYNRIIFSDGFVRRYSVKFDLTSSNLSISTTSWEDAGTYFCGVMHLNEIQFGSGTFLMLKGAKTTSDSVVQQPESQSVRSGDSVTLSCSVHSRQCTAEHTRVMWLKTSDHSAPEMISSSENKSNICQKTDSGHVTCVSHLRIRSRDDAGAYYCALSSCGQILLGNGTKINMEADSKPLSFTNAALILSNMVLGTVTLLLVVILYKTRREKPAEAADGGSQTGDAVVYSAVSVAHRSLSPRRATVRASRDAVVYSNLRHCQESTKASCDQCDQANENDD